MSVLNPSGEGGCPAVNSVMEERSKVKVRKGSFVTRELEAHMCHLLTLFLLNLEVQLLAMPTGSISIVS